MFAMIRTLVTGANARAEENLRDHFAVDLLEQKIRESDAALSAAKQTLAALIMRQRNEQRQLDGIIGQIADLEARTKKALKAGEDALARDAAAAIAELENEKEIRSQTVQQLTSKVDRMRLTLDKTNRRIIDLKQGMVQARAIDAESKAQRSINKTIGKNTSMREAEDLLNTIMNRDDAFEEAEVLDEIDGDLNHTNVRDRMAAQGFGEKTKSTADSVLERLGAKA
ncbi:MAG: PspA/IM30 family protein [Pseudomonadota bacterium]